MKKLVIELAAAAVIFTGGIFAALHFLAPQPAVGVQVAATAAPETKRSRTKTVVIAAPVRVFDDGIKAKLNLAPAIVNDTTEHVIAATQVRGSDRPQTVTTLIDDKTGESRTFTKFDPYPWFALERRGEARLSYGYRYDGIGAIIPKPIVRLGLTYDAIRVKAFVVGPVLQIDSDGRAFAGISAAYRW